MVHHNGHFRDCISASRAFKSSMTADTFLTRSHTIILKITNPL